MPSYTSVNIHIILIHVLLTSNGIYTRSLRTGIMEEYPVTATSQGTCVRIEQTSEAIRVTYEICRAGGARTGIENRCTMVMGGRRTVGCPLLQFGWVKCREHISLFIILCIIVYVTNKAHLSLICIVMQNVLHR